MVEPEQVFPWNADSFEIAGPYDPVPTDILHRFLGALGHNVTASQYVTT